MAQLINEAKRMQFLAGIITESQLNEGEKVGVVDVDIVKKIINKPEVQKMTDVLKDNPDAAKKLAAALSDPKAMAILSGKSNVSEGTDLDFSDDEYMQNLLLKKRALNTLVPDVISHSEWENSTPEELKVLLAKHAPSTTPTPEKEYSAKERIARFFKYIGVGTVGGVMMSPMLAIAMPLVANPITAGLFLSASIAGALVGAIGGAVATDGFTKKSFEEAEGQEDDLKSQIAKVIAFGKQ